jgi:uncharacterized delta-60 repeat protein
VLISNARLRLVFGALIVGLALSTGIALAAPGDLDTSFSGDGKTTIDFGGNEFSGAGATVAVTPDGGSVVAGETDSPGGTGAIAVAKLLPDGSLDPGFASGGLKVISHGFKVSSARAVAVQPDGKILVGGFAQLSSGDPKRIFEIDRLNADGSPDASFGPGHGVSVLDFGPPKNQEINALAIQDDGKIVAAGGINDGTVGSNRYAIARWNADGSLDSSFGPGGRTTANFDSDSEAFGVTLEADGKIIVAGANTSGAGPVGMHAVRFNADGSVDTSFGRLGEATPSTSGGAFNVAIQPGLGIVLAGFGGVVARLDQNGATDHTFGNDGLASLGVGGGVATGLVVQRNGKIVVGGDTSGDGELVAGRLNSDGSLDTGFGEGGVAKAQFDGSMIGAGAALQADGRILITGSTSGGNLDLAVARFEGDPTGPPLVKIKCDGVKATKVGTSGPDKLKGTNGRDVIAGLGGKDRINGRGGKDLICGGGGNDILRGGKGKDKILGGKGKDKLFGGPGRDVLNGGPGRDRQHP